MQIQSGPQHLVVWWGAPLWRMSVKGGSTVVLLDSKLWTYQHHWLLDFIINFVLQNYTHPMTLLVYNILGSQKRDVGLYLENNMWQPELIWTILGDVSGHRMGIGLIWSNSALLALPCSSSIAIYSHLLPASGTLVQWLLCEMLCHVQPALLCFHDKVIVRS